MNRITWLLLVAMAFAVLVSGCNAINGMGQDIQWMSDKYAEQTR